MVALLHALNRPRLRVRSRASDAWGAALRRGIEVGRFEPDHDNLVEISMTYEAAPGTLL
jgi:hypothetical protein